MPKVMESATDEVQDLINRFESGDYEVADFAKAMEVMRNPQRLLKSRDDDDDEDEDEEEDGDTYEAAADDDEDEEQAEEDEEEEPEPVAKGGRRMKKSFSQPYPEETEEE